MANKDLAKPRFQQAWATANTKAHTTFLKIMNGGGPLVSTSGGVVTLNTKAMLDELAGRVGVGQKIVDKLPADAGQLTVMRSNQLNTAQNTFSIIKGFSFWFPLIGMAMYILAMWLAKGRRRRALRWIGISFVLVGLLVLISRGLAESTVVSSLASTAAVEPAVTNVYQILTQLLHDMAISTITLGVFVLIGAWLGGPSQPAVGFRRGTAPWLRDYPVVCAAVAIVFYLFLIWWSPTIGFQTQTDLILNTILMVSGFTALLLITRKEFPDADAPDFGEWAKERWRSAKDSVQDRRGGIAWSRDRSGLSTRLDEAERLADLRDRGILTDAEFEQQKHDLLG